MTTKITLTLPDDLYQTVKVEYPDINASAVLADALRAEIDRRKRLSELGGEMQDVTVTDDEGRTMIFTGAFLAEAPDGSSCVYLTKRHRIAVVAHGNGGSHVFDFDNLEQAANDMNLVCA